LIVEDELLIAALLATQAGEAGYDVVGPVGRVEEASKLAEMEGIDAAVLDVHLAAGALSYPVADTLARRGIPFAFVTSEPTHGHCHGNLKEPHFGSVGCCAQAAAVAICHC
jgi:DNA-binding response OmpR family regulator